MVERVLPVVFPRHAEQGAQHLVDLVVHAVHAVADRVVQAVVGVVRDHHDRVARARGNVPARGSCTFARAAVADVALAVERIADSVAHAHVPRAPRL